MLKQVKGAFKTLAVALTGITILVISIAGTAQDLHQATALTQQVQTLALYSGQSFISYDSAMTSAFEATQAGVIPNLGIFFLLGIGLFGLVVSRRRMMSQD